MFFRRLESDFREFIRKGSAVDMAVGVITGAALGTLVNSLVRDILTPPIGLLAGGLDFSSLHIPLGHSARMNIGLFINAAISFVITMFAIFMVVRIANRLRNHGRVASRDCPYCKVAISPLATRCPECTSHIEPAEK
ncbi:MAG: large conductance mechanosensitive channel protein MscL [Rickettsiales bacterium]|jgi:large conductance mechanosensitive channel|nr:large conductance mechanosensitive channel protein MscL [Rickettsiales bacterium]